MGKHNGALGPREKRKDVFLDQLSRNSELREVEKRFKI